MKDWDTVWQDVHLATMVADGDPYGQIEDAAIAIQGGRIAWLGRRSDLPENHNATVHSGDNTWVTPGLIDCHTHLIYGGDRIGEFESRLNGASYEEIAHAGGGIMATVKHTRASSADTLYTLAHKRLQQFGAEGVTTVEIKSGYGLNTETEIRMLQIAQALGKRQPIDIVATFLGAHALPPEYSDNRDAYIDLICSDMIPKVAADNLAVAVDAFCEGIAFSTSEVSRVFTAAHAHDLKVKLHADQLSDTGGGKLAAEFNALSADHLEYLSAASAQAMAKSGTVAVLLPGAFYMLRETQLPPVDLLRQHGIPIAIASDSNPGTCPAYSLRLMINMACVLFRLTPEEALAGVTREAARALGLTDRGVLSPGKIADLAFWDIDKPAQLAFEIGGNRCTRVLKSGVEIN